MTVGSSIWTIRSPQNYAHRKTGLKRHGDTMADSHNYLPSAHLGGNHHLNGLILRKNT